MDTPSFPTTKSKYRSEYNTGVWDFGRLDEILKKIDEHSAMSTCLEKRAILPYFASLKQLWAFLRPFSILSWKKHKTKMHDDDCDNLWLDVLDWQAEYRSNPEITDYPLGLVKRLDLFHSNLLMMKQVFGFGLVMNRELTTKSKINRYMRTVGVKGGEFDKRIKV